jgi:hypothetical protein
MDDVRAAVANGGDVNRAKALHYAVGAGRNDLVSVLLELGADVKLADSIGLTPLHVGASAVAKMEDESAFEAGLKLLKMLLSKGADPTVKTLRGDDACDSVDESMVNMMEFMRVFGIYDVNDPTVNLLGQNAVRIKQVLTGKTADQSA